MKYLTVILVLMGALTLSACGTANNTAPNQAAVVESAVPTEKPSENITASPSAEPSATADDSKSTPKSSAEPSVTEGKKDKPVSTPSSSPTSGKNESDDKSSGTSGKKGTSKPAATPSSTPEKTEKSGEDASATEKPVSTEHVVEIINFGFSPAKLEIKVGDTVKFVNRDEIRHSATADDKSFNSELLGKDQSKTFTFDKQGEFSYFCMPHPGMKGLIIVKGD